MTTPIAPRRIQSAKSAGLIDPAQDGTAISYGGGDQTFATPTRWIYIGTAGNLAVRLIGSSADTQLNGLLAGYMYELQVKIIRQAGSTAAGVALW